MNLKELKGFCELDANRLLKTTLWVDSSLTLGLFSGVSLLMTLSELSSEQRAAELQIS